MVARKKKQIFSSEKDLLAEKNNNLYKNKQATLVGGINECNDTQIIFTSHDMVQQEQ